MLESPVGAIRGGVAADAAVTARAGVVREIRAAEVVVGIALGIEVDERSSIDSERAGDIEG